MSEESGAGGMNRLTEWARAGTSQHGEDGLIEMVLARLGDGGRRCVEFGAHDGLTNSNTARLWRDAGWRAVLIEADPARLSLLEAAADGFDTVVLHRFVRPSGDGHLECILSGAGESLEVDVLSIDIDGDDLAVFESLGDLRPRLVLCEYNPTIPWWLDVRGQPGSRTGCSLGALARSAGERGYKLIGATETNGVLVRVEDAAVFDDIDTELSRIAPTRWYTSIITDFDGRALAVGSLPFDLRTLGHLGAHELVGLPKEMARRDVVLRRRTMAVAGTLAKKVVRRWKAR